MDIQRLRLRLRKAINAINAINAIDAICRTVTASLTCATFSAASSGCSSVARCTALATLDSMDVKLYELLPFCTPQLYKFVYNEDRFGT